MKKQTVYLIISAASVVLAYGKPVEIRGYFAWVLWLAPIVLMILCTKKNAGLLRGAFIAVLACYFVSSGVFFLRNHGIRIAHTERSGSSVVEYCDIDPGAMGKVRCRRTEYYSVIESKLLSVRVVRSVEMYRGSYRDMGG